MVLNSLNFCLSGSFWFLHQIWRRVLLGILGCRFFPFITLNITCHSLLACRVSVEKSADSLMGLSSLVCYLSFFPCSFYYFISVFNFHQSDYYVSQCVSPWVSPAWNPLCSLDLVDYFFFHVWEVFSYYLFKCFLRSFLSLLSFWGPYNANVGAFNVFPEVS